MKYNLVIKEDARRDMLEAYWYYEECKAGLGEMFLEALQYRFKNITEHPQYYGFIDSKKYLRDVTVDGFPYVVIFHISGTDVIVYAVYQTKKKSYQ